MCEVAACLLTCRTHRVKLPDTTSDLDEVGMYTVSLKARYLT